MHDVEVFAEGLEFPEGPAFDRDGNLYVVELAGERVSRITPDGVRSTLCETGGVPNGSTIGPDGALWVTNNGGPDDPGWVERIDLATGTTEHVIEDPSFGGCNDLVFDAEGNLYFTDPHGSLRRNRLPGHVYCYSGGGELSRVATDYAFPNGIGISDDGRTLLVAETVSGIVWAHEIKSPGRLGERREYAHLPEGHLPDGFAFDAAGNLLVCGHFGGAISVFDAAGKRIDSIGPLDERVTNVAFGGPDFSTLYITESHFKRVSTFAWHTPGMKLFPDR